MADALAAHVDGYKAFTQCAPYTQIEMAALASGNELLHGEAVNIDMALTTEVRLNASSHAYVPWCHRSKSHFLTHTAPSS
jgi:hypothetical protein